jgi:biotin operon repressor
MVNRLTSDPAMAVLGLAAFPLPEPDNTATCLKFAREGHHQRVSQEEIMKRYALTFLLSLGTILLTQPLAAQTGPQVDAAGIARAIGKEGSFTAATYRVNFPRSDLAVKVGNVVIKPDLALTAWAAFVKAGETTMTYGDLVLLETEINPAISALEENGIAVTALHNHLLHESPRIMYIHFMGHGDEVAMAKGIRQALLLTKTPFEARTAAPQQKPTVAAEIEKIIGREGNMGDGVFHITVPRDDVHVTADGMMVPGNMGMNTPLNFQLDGGKAAINGDFMLLASEVTPVIKALRTHGIEVASIHNHMLGEEPRLTFMHFWAYGDALDLAKGLKAALEYVGPTAKK